ncbi:MAG: hypothetical protein R2749_30725 [Acidimicrobiales bacterium]
MGWWLLATMAITGLALALSRRPTALARRAGVLGAAGHNLRARATAAHGAAVAVSALQRHSNELRSRIDTGGASERPR